MWFICTTFAAVEYVLLIVAYFHICSTFAAHLQHAHANGLFKTVRISMRLRCWYSINKVTFLPIEIILEMWGIAMITSCLAATTSGSRGQWVGRLDKARQTFLHRNGRHGDWPHHSARMASAGLEWAAWRVWKKIETTAMRTHRHSFWSLLPQVVPTNEKTESMSLLSIFWSHNP